MTPFSLLKTSWKLLTPRQQLFASMLFILFSISSLIELFALGSAVPFVSLLIGDEEALNNEVIVLLSNYYSVFNFDSVVVFAGTIFILLLCCAFLVNIFTIFCIEWFGARVAVKFANDIVSKILKAPYVWFLKQNSSVLARRIYDDPQVVGVALYPSIMELLYVSILIIVIATALFITSPIESIYAIAILCLVFMILVFFVRPRIVRYISELREKGIHHNKVSVEVLSGIKEVMIKSRQNHFLGVYNKIFSSAAVARMKSSILNRMVPLSLLMFGQICLVVVALILYQSGFSKVEFASQMAFLILIFSRLLPSVSRIAGSYTKMMGVVPYVEALEKLHQSLDVITISENVLQKKREVANNWSKYELINVCYKYPETNNQVLTNFSFEINRSKSYGITGGSGAGKSTLIDIILGFLEAQSGEIFIDNIPIKDYSINSWRKEIGYVPQNPIIIDDSIRRNIAFGLPDSVIDDNKIWDALKLAGLDNYVNSLDQMLDTILGDKGMRLSGGQKQRIIIARALYDSPSILIFDEATSSLDNITEQEIQATLNSLHGKVTTLTIAHRLNTIKDCDVILYLENGMLKDKGTYQELLKRNPLFQVNQNNAEK